MSRSTHLPHCPVPSVMLPPHPFQIADVGEVVLEVGAPSGWGPVGMDLPRMELCLTRAREAAARHGAGVSLLRPIRQVDVQTVAGKGGCCTGPGGGG